MGSIGTVLLGSETQAARPTLVAAPDQQYSVSIGYLRAFITVLVVAHHAALAYHPFAPPAPASLVAEPRWWMAFPVTDTARWSGFAALVGFNDIFFMSLMFFLSGLFVWKSLQRKGAGAFVRDRVVRLGIPFAVAAALIAPLGLLPHLSDDRVAYGCRRILAAVACLGHLAGGSGVVHLGPAGI